MLDFDAFDYFEDLFALSLVVVPLVPRAAVAVGLDGFCSALVGMYLVFLIAPRLMAFYVVFWLVVFVTPTARRCGHRSDVGDPSH